MQLRIHVPSVRMIILCLGFSLAGPVAHVAGANLVTYQVDMGVQTTSGNFVPGSDSMMVAGNFNGWTLVSLTNVSGTSVYEGTLANPLAAGEWENHKFVISRGAGGEEWESIPDRFFQVTAEDQVLPVVLFNNQADLPVTNSVTWSVDMSIQTQIGEFESLYDEVFVAGSMNGWDPYLATLTPSPADTNVWTITMDVTATVGTTIEYKFVMLNINGEVWERDGLGPGGARNRQFTFTNETTALPVVFFDDETVSAVVTQQTTFVVSLAEPIARGDHLPTDPVWMAGEMTGWSLVELTPTPTNATAWAGSFELTGNLDGVVAYKFARRDPGGGEVWEDDGVGGTPGPRQLALSGVDGELPMAAFNDVDDLGVLNLQPGPAGTATLEWDGGPLIRLQRSPDPDGAYIDIPGTQGISLTNVNLGAESSYFRVKGP